MKDQHGKPLFWLMPLLFTLPFAAAAGLVFYKYGDLLMDLVHVAAKVVLIP